MPFNRDTFGSHLRRERERRGISLDDITARTKIARSLLAKLERGDLSDWPSGIFRRGFFRGYAGAIGLDADVLMDDFLRLFPDAGAEPAAAPQTAAQTPPNPVVGLRLATDDAAPSLRVSRANVRGALIDTLGVLLATAAVSAVTGHAAIVAALIAVLYHAATTAWGRGVLVAARAPAAPPLEGTPARQARPRGDARRAEPARRSGHRLRAVEPPVGRSSRALR